MRPWGLRTEKLFCLNLQQQGGLGHNFWMLLLSFFPITVVLNNASVRLLNLSFRIREQCQSALAETGGRHLLLFLLKMGGRGAGKMTQWLRVFAALTEDTHNYL